MICVWLVPLIPFGFNITDQAYTTSNVTVHFEWDQPIGRASEVIVDNYYVTVSPMPLHPSLSDFVLPNSPLTFETVLNYNIVYTALIFAENCAGQSEVSMYPENVLYGNYYVQ